jgi:cobalt/nickel transport system ATP-binding protein
MPEHDPPALFLIGHGTRSATGVEQFFEFVDAVRAARPGFVVGSGLIEFVSPDLDTGIDLLVEQGIHRLVAVPLVLLGAGHMKDDGPAALLRARIRHPQFESTYARDLGVHPLVLAAAEDRIREAGGADLNSDAVVVVSRGSSDPDANGDLAKVARLLADRRGLGLGLEGPARASGLGLVEPAFVSLAPPDLATALERCYLLGARRITVAPYFLFTGILPERITNQAREFADAHPDARVEVAGVLRHDPRIVELVWERYDEARAGNAVMNCDGCLYRAPLPGYEDRVGAPPFG